MYAKMPNLLSLGGPLGVHPTQTHQMHDLRLAIRKSPMGDELIPTPKQNVRELSFKPLVAPGICKPVFYGMSAGAKSLCHF